VPRYSFEVHVELPDGNGEELHLLEHLYRRMQELPAARQMKLRCGEPIKEDSTALTVEEFEIETQSTEAVDVYVNCPRCKASKGPVNEFPKLGDLINEATEHLSQHNH
jgi:hypothetical protein